MKFPMHLYFKAVIHAAIGIFAVIGVITVTMDLMYPTPAQSHEQLAGIHKFQPHPQQGN